MNVAVGEKQQEEEKSNEFVGVEASKRKKRAEL